MGIVRSAVLFRHSVVLLSLMLATFWVSALLGSACDIPPGTGVITDTFILQRTLNECCCWQNLVLEAPGIIESGDPLPGNCSCSGGLMPCQVYAANFEWWQRGTSFPGDYDARDAQGNLIASTEPVNGHGTACVCSNNSCTMSVIVDSYCHVYQCVDCPFQH